MDFIRKLEKDYDIKVTDGDIDRLKAQFDFADRNGDGEITVEEFKDSIGDKRSSEEASLA